MPRPRTMGSEVSCGVLGWRSYQGRCPVLGGRSCRENCLGFLPESFHLGLPVPHSPIYIGTLRIVSYLPGRNVTEARPSVTSGLFYISTYVR